MNPCELTFVITALANAVASNFNDEEIGVLAAVATQFGDTLATILAQRQLCESVKNKNQTNDTFNKSDSSNDTSASNDSGNSDDLDNSNGSDS